ncbi:MarR family winged helix-turn-helix transcriptional regulator [Nucisporomicrobium flavum]|uniref:MarR family winged helix-turn-helix transcriptional regulator n=1 Tax=Nucisporomicrobium flavum TaxID=2785915 RepID=UPI001F4687A8|nr:MarR family transcriptional regulator [Nucisporomicrobium flavum]
MAENERLIADIMHAQQQLQHLFAYDRSDPLFSSQLTMPQLKILLLLHRLGDTSGRELAGLLGVSLATLSGMVDRLVTNDLVTRAEDPHDRRVRRIRLSATGTEMISRIITAGTERQTRLLRKLTDAELRTVRDAMQAMVRVATEDATDTEAGDPTVGAARRVTEAVAAEVAESAAAEVADAVAAEIADAAAAEVAEARETTARRRAGRA